MKGILLVSGCRGQSRTGEAFQMVHMTSVEEDGAVRVERGWRADSELHEGPIVYLGDSWGLWAEWGWPRCVV